MTAKALDSILINRNALKAEGVLLIVDDSADEIGLIVLSCGSKLYYVALAKKLGGYRRGRGEYGKNSRIIEAKAVVMVKLASCGCAEETSKIRLSCLADIRASFDEDSYAGVVLSVHLGNDGVIVDGREIRGGRAGEIHTDNTALVE
jgi:hypothetical protein